MKYLILILLALQFTNCTVQKRLYRSGYHVEWKNSIRKNSNHKPNTTEKSLSEGTSSGDMLLRNDKVEQTLVYEEPEVEIPGSDSEADNDSDPKSIDAVAPSSIEKVTRITTYQKVAQTKIRETSTNIQDEWTVTSKSILNRILEFFVVLLGFCCGLVLSIPDLIAFIVLFDSPLPFADAFEEKRWDSPKTFLSAFARGGYIGIFAMLILIAIAAIALFFAYIYAEGGLSAVFGVLIVLALIVLFFWWLGNVIGGWFYDMGHRG